MSKKTAMDAVAAARDVHEEAWRKLGKVIAMKKFRGMDYKRENRLRSSASARISHYNTLLLEMKAAAAVVNPPPVEQIRDMVDLARKVREIAVADAMRKEGLQMIVEAMDRVRDTVKNTKISAG